MTPHPERPATAGNTTADADEPRDARQVMLPSALCAAGLARQQVRAALASWGLGRLEDTAALLATELVGNAVQHARHGGNELMLRIADTGAWLRIDVSDNDPRPPQPHLPAELDESGFGLVLVEALAAKWGVDQATEGKTVWIELATGRADCPPSRGGCGRRQAGAQPAGGARARGRGRAAAAVGAARPGHPGTGAALAGARDRALDPRLSSARASAAAWR